MIPALWKATSTDPGVNVINEVNVGIWYLAYVQQRVFEPAGVSGVTCSESNDATAVLVYNAGNTAAGGKLLELNPPDLDGCGGHAHLHLSALDLAKFMAHLTHGTLLDADQRQLMDSARLGWNKESNTTDTAGIYWHGGDGVYEQRCHARVACVRDEVPGQHPGDHRRQLEHHLGPVPVLGPARRLQEGDRVGQQSIREDGPAMCRPVPRERGVSLEPDPGVRCGVSARERGQAEA